MKIKINPDAEKAKSIRALIKSRKEFVKNFKDKVFPTVICENYYEIIKELSTALFFAKGFKFVGEYSHKELMSEIASTIKLEESDKIFLDDLRTRRNGSLYYVEQFSKEYLQRNDLKINQIIELIEKYLNKEIGEDS